MSDVKLRSRDAASGGRKPPTPRVVINRELFLSACAEKGALTEEKRAALLKTTPKMTYNYGYGYVEPGLTKARQGRRLDAEKHDRCRCRGGLRPAGRA